MAEPTIFPDRKASKVLLQTRCNPKLNYKLIQNLKGEHKFRKILCSLGLESLLQLQVSRLHRELCADLARKIDVERSVLLVHGKEIPLTYASVTKVLGFACSGPCIANNILITKEERLATSDRLNLDSSGRMSQYTLWNYLEGCRDFSEEFRAKYLLFTIGTFLRPTTNVHVHYKDLLPLLNGMSRLENFNWAKFILDGLLEAVQTFQLRRTKSVGGCLLYLQLLYLHCISPVPWTPCLGHWTDERVTVVVRLMREQGGIQSDKVPVRRFALPISDTSEEQYVEPQLLMHEVTIARVKRRLDDIEYERDAIFREVRKVLCVLNRRVEILEDSSNGDTQP